MPVVVHRVHTHVVRRTLFVFNYAELFVYRLLVATASLLFALFLALDPTAFHRHGFELMSQLAPWWVWVAAFTMHGAGAYWRVYGIRQRRCAALVINALGFSVWTLSTICTNLSIGGYMPSTAMEWVMCTFSGWCLYRTGRGEEVFPE